MRCVLAMCRAMRSDAAFAGSWAAIGVQRKETNTEAPAEWGIGRLIDVCMFPRAGKGRSECMPVACPGPLGHQSH